MSTNSKAGQRKALIVGISDYTNFEKLDFCKNDGKEVYEVLSALGYEISDRNKLIGKAMGTKVKDTIYDFFDDKTDRPDDTLLFYYSGHGVLGNDGDVYLASSDTDPDKPYRRGFPFEELTKMMQNTIPNRVVVILDCCYSGSAKISKGNEEDAAKIGRLIVEQKSRKLPEGQGRYILSSSQSYQESYALTTGEHSMFTYYLLKGLRRNTESIDIEGNVTPQSLSNYIVRAIMSLPPNERPKQRPILKTEESGNVVLASYPDLRIPPPTSPITPLTSNPPTKSSVVQVHKRILGTKTKISIAVGIAAVISVVLALVLFNQQMLTNEKYALYEKGNALLLKNNYTGAVAYFNKSLAIDPNFKDVLNSLDNMGRLKYVLYDKGSALLNRGNYTGAITYFNKALAIDPKFKEALNGEGYALNSQDDYSRAIPYLNRALSLDPSNELALVDKGWALNGLGNHTGAIKYIDEVLKIDPGSSTALGNKGWALNGLGNYAEAIKYLNNASASEPNNKHILNNKGWALNGLGNYAEAIKSIDEALNIDHDYTLALINKGWSLYGLGNCTGAIAYFGKASKTDPKFELTLKQLTQEFILPHCAQTTLHTALLPSNTQTLRRFATNRI